MLKTLEVKNFKSAENLELAFGRVNVFIGENGSGKSNILEAITFTAAALNEKLDVEYLENRGIRVPAAKYMRSGFNQDSIDKPIEITVSMTGTGASATYIINHSNETYAQWQVGQTSTLKNNDISFNLLDVDNMVQQRQKLINAISLITGTLNSSNVQDFEFKDEFDKKLKQLESIDDLAKKYEVVLEEMEIHFSPLNNFVIYSPQNKQLRNLTEEGSIRPVGIHGEGLFKLLREIHNQQPEAMADIEAGLSLIGWYQSMDLHNEPELPEDELFIQDRYLPEPLTQRSANEGFLYVLFYMAVVVSKDTPKIFAIDNIDAALNPKLCAKITSYLVELAKKYDKQLFLTTQNPATLDGIDLADEQQKLFVVSRKRHGQTTAKQFTADSMPRNDDQELIMLSEAMIRGYIGGLPKGF